MIVLDTKVVFCADQKSMVFVTAETRDPKVPNFMFVSISIVISKFFTF